MSDVLETMKRECVANIDAEIASHEKMIEQLKERRKEVEEHSDIRQIISLNASLSRKDIQ